MKFEQKHIQENRFNSDKEQNDIGLTQQDFVKAYFCNYQNKIQSALWTRATVNLLTLACSVNQNVSCHLFVLDGAYRQDKDAISAGLDKNSLKLQQLKEKR